MNYDKNQTITNDNQKSFYKLGILRRETLSNIEGPTTRNLSPYDRLIESCLIFLIVFTPLAYGTVQPWAVTVFEIAAALMFLFWIFKILGSGEFESIYNPLTPFILLFILYIYLQLLFSYLTLTVINRTHLFGSTYFQATRTEFLKVIAYTLIFFVVSNTIKTQKQINRIIFTIVTMGFLMSMFFLMRYFGIKAPRGLINPDHFSGYLGMIIPLSLGLLFIPPRTGNRQPTIEQRFLLFFSIITMSAALFFTMSRGGMFAFVGALIFIAFLTLSRRAFKRKGWILSAVAIFIVLTVVWLGATPVVERLLSVKAEIASRYFGGRLPIWQGTVNIINDYFIFGTGLGTFSYVFPKYQPLQIIKKHYTYAHSDFLELLSEVGIVGFSIFLLGLIVFVIYAFRRLRLRHDPYVIGMSIGIFGSLTGIFIYSFADFNLHIPANAILLSIIVPLFMVILNSYYGQKNTRYKTLTANRKPLTRLHYALCILTIIVTIIFITNSVKPAIADYYYRKTHYNKAIQFDPTNALYHYELGKLYLKQVTSHQSQVTQREYLNNAISQYEKAIRLNPTNSKYHQSLAWLYGNIGRNKEAIREFEKAVSSEPNNPHRHRAYAIYCFDQARLINSNANKATNSINLKEFHLNTAVFEYRQAVNIDSSFAKEAIEKLFFFTKDYNELKQILPNLPEFHIILASFLQDKNVWIENETKFKDEMHNVTNKAPYYIAIAQWYYRCKDYNKALSTLYDCLTLYPNSAQIHFTIADFAVYGGGNLELAFKEFKKALELEPENAYYRYWYAVHLFRNKKYQEAEKQFKKVIELNPTYSNRIEIFKKSNGREAE